MNEKNIFKGDCYMCSKNGFITRVDSWSSQKGIRGSWRMLCNDCVKEWGWEPNRFPNDCLKCKSKFIGSKKATICKNCSDLMEGKKTVSGLKVIMEVATKHG